MDNEIPSIKYENSEVFLYNREAMRKIYDNLCKTDEPHPKIVKHTRRKSCTEIDLEKMIQSN